MKYIYIILNKKNQKKHCAKFWQDWLSYYEIELKLNANQLQTTPFNEHKSAKSPLDCSARFRLQQCVMKLQYIKFYVYILVFYKSGSENKVTYVAGPMHVDDIN